MRSLKEIRNQRFEKQWAKKLPQKYKELSREEIERQLDKIRAELAEVFQNEDFSMEEVKQIMEKHEEFIDMANKWRTYHMEKKLRGM